MKTSFFKILLLLLIIPLEIRAVIINEIAWMGTKNSANDEWIELYNNSLKDVSIDGWRLTTQDKSTEILLSGKIPSKGFFLLERTDDNSVPGTKADLIYKGSLSNKGEYIRLVGANQEIIEELDFSSGWSHGDNKSKRTMERTETGWQTSKNPEGTPKRENSIIQLESYPSEIYFYDILPSPEGPDAENEWIKLKNKNDFAVDLKDWTIEDSIGKTEVFIFPSRTINPGEIITIGRKESKITLNNDGDSLFLRNPNGELIDSISYEKAESPNKQLSDEAQEEKAPLIPKDSRAEIKASLLKGSFKSIFVKAFFISSFLSLLYVLLKKKLDLSKEVS